MSEFRSNLKRVLKSLHQHFGIQWDGSTLVWDSPEDLDWGITQSEVELEGLRDQARKASKWYITDLASITPSGVRLNPLRTRDLEASDRTQLSRENLVKGLVGRIRRKEQAIKHLKNKAMIEGTGPDGEFVTFQTESGRTPGPLGFGSGWTIEIDGEKHTAREVGNLIRYGLTERNIESDFLVDREARIREDLDWR